MKPYPPPLEIPALREPHTHTFILLHGCGSNAERFGRELLSSTSLATRLPTTKFVFPTARKRRSTALKRIPIHQWFDNYSLDDPDAKPELQIDGLVETGQFLRTLIEREAGILGQSHDNGEEGDACAYAYDRVLLGGLSQGCAAAGFALLGGGLVGEGKKLGAFVGLSGWLPFHAQLGEILGVGVSSSSTPVLPGAGAAGAGGTGADVDDGVSDSDSSDTETESESESEDGSGKADESNSEGSREYDDSIPDPHPAEEEGDEESFNPFAPSPQPDDDDNGSLPLPLQAINYARDILDLPPLPLPSIPFPTATTTSTSIQAPPLATPHLLTPIFIGHGAEDAKVSARLGELMAHTFGGPAGLGMDVTLKVYAGLGHWYGVREEMDDILEFLGRKVPGCVVVARVEGALDEE